MERIVRIWLSFLLWSLARSLWRMLALGSGNSRCTSSGQARGRKFLHYSKRGGGADLVLRHAIGRQAGAFRSSGTVIWSRPCPGAQLAGGRHSKSGSFIGPRQWQLSTESSDPGGSWVSDPVRASPREGNVLGMLFVWHVQFAELAVWLNGATFFWSSDFEDTHTGGNSKSAA